VTALEDLEASQLILFIQSFGIPTPSMSKLLSCLDRASQLDPEGVTNAVLDTTYMTQLVQVQRMRGASGGQTFLQALGARDDTASHVTSAMTFAEQRQQRPLNALKKTNEAQTATLSVDTAIDSLVTVFHATTTPPGEKHRIHRTLIQHLAKDADCCGVMLKALRKLILEENFVRALCLQANLTTSLLRIMIAKCVSCFLIPFFLVSSS